LQSYDGLLAYLKSKDLKISGTSANRMTLTARGTRAQVEQAFDVGIHDYQFGARKFYANDRDPGLPAQYAPAVQAVQGLSEFCPAAARVSQGCLSQSGLPAELPDLAGDNRRVHRDRT